MKTLAFLLLSIATAAHAATLEFAGILGNSGESGDTLVRFGEKLAPGIGVVRDSFGTLWDRGGAGVLNRYAPDGRWLASYKIPANVSQSDRIAIAGGTLLLLIGQQLYALDVQAPAGTEVRALKQEADGMSAGTFEGAVALSLKGQITLYNLATNERKPWMSVPKAQLIEVDPSGALYVQADGKVWKWVNGKAVEEGWPKSSPGDRLQFCGGYFYGNVGHGTLKRFDAALEPLPGVVLGGMSGSFIGKLEQNSELWQGRGIAHVRDELYAISGHMGTMHLLAWDGATRQMSLVRRIGATTKAHGLVIDGDGRVWCNTGSWNLSDGPDSPQHYGINVPEHVGQAVLFANDRMLAAGGMWNKPTIFSGFPGDELRCERVEKNLELPSDITGTALIKDPGQWMLVVVDARGKGCIVGVGGDGKFQKGLGAVELKLKTPGLITSLVAKDDKTLLAAAGNAIVEFKRTGLEFAESRRWPETLGLGDSIFIAAHAGRLWVADTEKHCVVLLDLEKETKLAEYGTKGDGLQNLRAPKNISACGARAVVFDSGNQRLVRLSVRD